MGVLGASVALAAAFAVRGPQLAIDSSGYLDHSPMRSAGYPLLLDVARLVAGSQGLRLAVFLQALGSFAAIALLIDRLRVRLGAGPLVQVLAAMGLAAGPVAFAGTIVSESLAFTCFIAAVARALDAACDRDDASGRHLGACAAWLAGATLARPQFLFAWPLLGLGVIAHLVARRGLRPTSRRLQLPLMLLVVFLGQWSIQRGYNQLRHGRLQGSGLTGLQLATVNLYLADRGDVDAIAATLPPDDGRALEVAFGALQERHLLASTTPGGYTPAMYFHHVYNDVCWEAIAAAWGLAEDSAAPVERWDQLDAVTRSVALGLLARHPVRYVKHVLSMMWWQYKFFLLLALGALVLAGSALRLRLGDSDGDAAARAVLVAAALWFANLTLVCMVELPIARYCFYTDGLLVAVIVAVVGRALAAPPAVPVAARGGA